MFVKLEMGVFCVFNRIKGGKNEKVFLKSFSFLRLTNLEEGVCDKFRIDRWKDFFPTIFLQD